MTVCVLMDSMVASRLVSKVSNRSRFHVYTTQEQLASAANGTDDAQPQAFPTLLFEVGGLPCVFRIGSGTPEEDGDGEGDGDGVAPRVTRVPIEEDGGARAAQQQREGVQCQYVHLIHTQYEFSLRLLSSNPHATPHTHKPTTASPATSPPSSNSPRAASRRPPPCSPGACS